MNKLAALAVVVLCGCAHWQPVSAQEEDLFLQERVVVTGSRIARGGDGGGYNVYKRIRADFMLVDVYFQSGTRDTSARHDELKTMFDRLLAAARDDDRIFLEAGGNYDRVPIETVLFSDILEDEEYDDRSAFQLTLGIEVDGDSDFDVVLQRGQDFVDDIPLAGRVEAYLDDTQYIGARDVNAYRPELLGLISEEAKALQATFGRSDISITGLESRLKTATTGPLQLDVYLPYSISVKMLAE